MKRAARSGVIDLWHRDPRAGEQVAYPEPGQQDKIGGVWCMDRTHFRKTASMVCTTFHGRGMRWRAAWVDGKGNQRAKNFAKKDEAQTYIDTIVTQIGTSTYVDTQKSATLFRDVAEEWMAIKRTKLKPSTLAGYQSLLDNNLLLRWGEMKLSEIDNTDIQKWVTWMVSSKDARQCRSNKNKINEKRQPLSAARAVHAHKRLVQILDYAVSTKRLGVNPAKGVERPRVVPKRERSLTHEEIAKLAAAASAASVAANEPDIIGPMITALAYSGYRVGESRSLRVNDVELERRRVQVARSTTPVTGQGLVEDTTKTSQQRPVPMLTDDVYDIFAAAVAGRFPSEYLWPGPDGGPMPADYFKWRFHKAAKVVGLEGITPKTLRHTAGSLALQAGASVVTVQKLLGHENAMTTMRVYSHMLPDDFDNLAAKMNQIVKRPV